jgi:hypothetical protein
VRVFIVRFSVLLQVVSIRFCGGRPACFRVSDVLDGAHTGFIHPIHTSVSIFPGRLRTAVGAELVSRASFSPVTDHRLLWLRPTAAPGIPAWVDPQASGTMLVRLPIAGKWPVCVND